LCQAAEQADMLPNRRQRLANLPSRIVNPL